MPSIKLDKVNKYSLWVVFFMTFLGFYVVVLFAVNSGLTGITRLLTIPARGIIGIGCVILFILNIRRRAPFINWFIVFTIIYLTRVWYDMYNNHCFYISYPELLFYFISFVMIPFISLSKIDFTKINLKKLYIVFLTSAIMFGVLATLSYARFIGQVSRLSSSIVGEDVVNPLILSYSATLIIGVVTLYLISNKPGLRLKMLSYITIIFSITPFFLGASRGSIMALTSPFIFLTISNLSFRNIFKSILFTSAFIAIIAYLDQYLQSGLLSRFLSIGSDIESGSSSAIRLNYWDTSFSQFVEHPLVGDKLLTNGLKIYPHNILLEVLQSVGIVGFLPFVILIIKGLNSSLKIFKYNKAYGWITVFFLQALLQNMFSGAVYSAAWFWSGLAIVLSVEYNLNKITKQK